MNRRRTWVALAAALAIASTLVSVGGASAQADPNAYELTEQYVPSFDGTLMHVYVFRPTSAGPVSAPTSRTPVVLTFTPYDNTGGSIGGNYATPTNDAPPNPPGGLVDAGLFSRGYTYVQVADRGTGGSGGCFDLWGPDNQRDGKTMIEWAGSQPWSNEQVLTFGASAGSFSQIAAMSQRPKYHVAAVLDRASIGSSEAWTNGVRTTTGTLWGGAWEANRLIPPSLVSPPEYIVNAESRNVTNPECHAEQYAGPLSEASIQYWMDRDSVVDPVLALKTPVLFVGLFDDYNAREDVFISMYNRLSGPHWGFFGQWNHGIGTGPNGEPFGQITMDWFDHWAHNKKLKYPERALVQDIDGRWRSEDAWPPADAKPHLMPLLPGSYVDTANNAEETEPPTALRFSPAPPPVATGQGSWTFTRPLSDAVHIAGYTWVTANVSVVAPVSLVTLVYDIHPDGAAHFVARGAAAVQASGKRSFDLYPQDWTFVPGHRIGVLVTSADVYFFNPSNTLTPVTLKGGSVALPALRCLRDAPTPAGVPNFKPRTPPAPFVVPMATIASSTTYAAVPPAMDTKPIKSCRAKPIPAAALG